MVHEVVVVMITLEIVEILDSGTAMVEVEVNHVVNQVSYERAGKKKLKVDPVEACDCD